MKQLKDVLHYYLPHGVKYIDYGYEDDPVLTLKTIRCYNDGSMELDDDDNVCIAINKDIKPLLFPLSSLTEEIVQSCGYQKDGLDILISDIQSGEVKSEVMFDLIKNKWDVFGLINSGQAIAVTEENNPYV